MCPGVCLDRLFRHPSPISFPFTHWLPDWVGMCLLKGTESCCWAPQSTWQKQSLRIMRKPEVTSRGCVGGETCGFDQTACALRRDVPKSSPWYFCNGSCLNSPPFPNNAPRLELFRKAGHKLGAPVPCSAGGALLLRQQIRRWLLLRSVPLAAFFPSMNLETTTVLGQLLS